MRSRLKLSLVILISFALTLPWGAVFLSSAPPAYAAFPGENGEILFTYPAVVESVNSDGSGSQFVAGCSDGCGRLDWSPSGERFVHAYECDECLSKLVIDRADGTHRQVLKRGADPRSAAWSPGGHRIAFIRDHWSQKIDSAVSDIITVRLDGSDRKRIDRTFRRWHKSDLDWSSRNRFVFRASPGKRKGNELFTLRPDGSHLRRLTNNNASDSRPDWSPNGKRLAFVHHGKVWNMDVRSKRKSLVAMGHTPIWSPDGSLIAFLVGARDIHTARPSGKDNTSLSFPTGLRITDMDWRPRPL